MRRILIFIEEERPDLVKGLKQSGIEAQLGRRKTLIEPRRIDYEESSAAQVHMVYQVPHEIKGMGWIPLIEADEMGGGSRTGGNAQVVCGPDGKRLLPYEVKKSGPLANQVHACFRNPWQIFTVTATRDGHVEITRFTATNMLEKLIVEKVLVWSGHYEDLPEAFDRFSMAMHAALRKAICYHCREVHFALERAENPQGNEGGQKKGQ